MFNDQHVKSVLERYYPKSAIRCLEEAETKFIALQERQQYADASLALRRLAVNVDGWPIPPAGLFVVEERTAYLRSTSAMTVCHEAGHALDCALGGGFYLSGVDPRIRRAFASATAFVTPYAASACDEYFAVMWNKKLIPVRAGCDRSMAAPHPSAPAIGDTSCFRMLSGLSGT